jgi:hypothetical protein
MTSSTSKDDQARHERWVERCYAEKGLARKLIINALAAYSIAVETRVDVINDYALARRSTEDGASLTLTAYDTLTRVAQTVRADASAVAARARNIAGWQDQACVDARAGEKEGWEAHYSMAYQALTASLADGTGAGGYAQRCDSAFAPDDPALALARACDAYAASCSDLAAALAKLESTRAKEITARGTRASCDDELESDEPENATTDFQCLSNARSEYNIASKHCEAVFDECNTAYDALIHAAAVWNEGQTREKHA